MTTTVAAGESGTTNQAGRVLALAAAEIRLMTRNRTVAVSSILLPLALGAFYVWSFGTGDDPAEHAAGLALQIAVVLGMGIYVTATQTVVARRHSGVLKRLRTSGLSDRGLLLATVAPSVALGLAQFAIFAAINVVVGVPMPTDYLPLALGLLGGLALVVTAALATAVVTPSPERAQITTLPLTFVLLGTAIVLAIAPVVGWWQALVALPGAAVGQLVQLAMTGQTWTAGFGGVPVVLPSVVALLVWPVVFGMLAKRRFRWDPRR